MTSKIVDSYRQNFAKIKEIDGLFLKLKTLNATQEEIAMRIIRYYNVLFKNISSKRKEVKIKGEKKSYVLTRAGLAKKDEWQLNSINLINASANRTEFLKELCFLAKKENLIQFKGVLSHERYKIFNDFLKKAKLLGIKTDFSLDTTQQTQQGINYKIIKEYRNGNHFILKEIVLEMTYNALRITKPLGEKILIPLYNMCSLENASYLEQIFPEARKLLSIAIKTKEKEINNLNKFIVYLRKKFENQLVLEELYYRPAQNENRR
jgi:hypothetical protein